MNIESKKTSLIILGITALVCSGTFFSLINDPEGPNLLVVVVLAGIIYGLSWAAYSFSTSLTGLKRILLAIAAQVIIVSGLYFGLR